MTIDSDWLGITKQQLELLLIAYDLGAGTTAVSAANMLSEYEKRNARPLKRQNLFTQLKQLLELGLLNRLGHSDYQVNAKRIRELMTQKRKELKDRFSAFEHFAGDLENKLKDAASKQSRPVARYLTPDQYMKTIADLLTTCRKYYADSPFPNLCYTSSLFEGISRRAFVSNQIERCIELRKMHIYYLTDLNISLAFRRAMRIFGGDAERAASECNKVIDNLLTLVRHPFLDMRYMEVLPGPHMYIFETDQPREVILSLRGSIVSRAAIPFKEERDPYGGVSLYSPEIAREARQIYLSSFNKAIKLNSKQGKKVIENIRGVVEKLYEEARKKSKL